MPIFYMIGNKTMIFSKIEGKNKSVHKIFNFCLFCITKDGIIVHS
jgi:hypothetical protein